MLDEKSYKPLDLNQKSTVAELNKTLELSPFEIAKLAQHEKANEARRAANARNNSAERLKKFQFKKGEGGNRGGVRTVWSYYEARVRNLTPEILQRLMEILKNGRDKDALRAAEILLERAWGKATEQIHVNHSGAQVPIINISIGNSTEPVRTLVDVTPTPRKAIDEKEEDPALITDSSVGDSDDRICGDDIDSGDSSSDTDL